MRNRKSKSCSHAAAVRPMWLPIALAFLFLLAIVALLLVPRKQSSSIDLQPQTPTTSSDSTAANRFAISRTGEKPSRAAPELTAEEIVAAKVSQFGRTRRELVRSIARRSNQALPDEVERFFDAIEGGHWEEIKSAWDSMAKRSGQYDGSSHSPELDPYWPAILDAYGVADQAHLWPAQKLLDYGQAILEVLRPGMVYVGGTDNGRWIPELLNETADGERHIIVTQNAFADGRYLDYVKELYGSDFNVLTQEDSQRAFQEYITDAQNRFKHDQQFPDEPKQVRPGEDIKMVSNRVQVSGQVAVMAINEKLLQILMAKNPDRSFALQESFPLKGTYPGSLPLGPIMELRAAPGADEAFNAERAEQTVAYWQTRAQQVLSDPEGGSSDAALKSYSHDTTAAANLLAWNEFAAEAEQAYRLASQLWPENPESVGALADLLARNGREQEGRQLLEQFNRKYPDRSKDLKLTSTLWSAMGDKR